MPWSKFVIFIPVNFVLSSVTNLLRIIFLLIFKLYIPQLCYEIQQRVKEFIESEIGVKILSIDITVDGVIYE